MRSSRAEKLVKTAAKVNRNVISCTKNTCPAYHRRSGKMMRGSRSIEGRLYFDRNFNRRTQGLGSGKRARLLLNPLGLHSNVDYEYGVAFNPLPRSDYQFYAF